MRLGQSAVKKSCVAKKNKKIQEQFLTYSVFTSGGLASHSNSYFFPF